MISGFLRRWSHILGLNETRCAHCLRPFLPAGDTRGASADDIAGAAAPLCPECRALFSPYCGPRCPRCGLPTAEARASGQAVAMFRSGRDSRCGRCLNDDPPWGSLAYYGLYCDAVRDVLLRLKFDGELSLAPLLGACLLEASRCLPRPDALLAVPQHPAHLRRRGFNQAHELAKALHCLAGLPLRPELLRRTKTGPPQAGLSASLRRRNVLGSFQAAPQASGLRLWLIDDVMTTGSTLAAACLALRAAGALEVCALCVARTPRHG
ncbi:ComF family protein [uncultured Desulfovibrio sp.]|uniref:ComF family protein n=1 Tax=uncultured Desulfovibrio sp. TaxID=167968 RepID=UPI0003A308CF|nr:ComF family protein [uncultured Desulfovibrio sp.]